MDEFDASGDRRHSLVVCALFLLTLSGMGVDAAWAFLDQAVVDELLSRPGAETGRRLLGRLLAEEVEEQLRSGAWQLQRDDDLD